MSIEKKKEIVFTVPPTAEAVTDYGAILSSHVHDKKVNKYFSASYPIPSWGLLWIEENCPGVEILDMPDWKSLENRLKAGVDILGISFYTYQVPAVIKMVEMARKAGVKEIWGGNYGTQTPGISHYFDRIIYGNAEQEIYRLVHDKELEEIKHPTIVQSWKLGGLFGKLIRTPGLDWHSSGIIWTIKGCYYKCSFCVSPKFIGQTKNKISLAALKEVLDKYKEMGIKTITIMDLDFMMDKKYAEQVIDLLHERNFKWTCMTRIDHIKERVSELRARGCELVFIGVESLNEITLREQNKYSLSHKQEILDIFSELERANMGYFLFYMLGFENDTYSSLKREIDFLSKLRASFYQFQVVTPLPGSKMFEDYKDKVINWDWSYWHCNALVWKHPHITPEQMDELLVYAKKKTSLTNNLLGIIKRGGVEESLEGHGLIKLLSKLLFKTLQYCDKITKKLQKRPGATDIYGQHLAEAATATVTVSDKKPVEK